MSEFGGQEGRETRMPSFRPSYFRQTTHAEATTETAMIGGGVASTSRKLAWPTGEIIIS